MSRLSQIDFDNIPFGRHFSDHMFLADFKNGSWTDFRIEPFGPISFSPSILALHYGQSIFEGMKATKTTSGEVKIFRPEMHAERFNLSAIRLGMPPIPTDAFINALEQLVGLDHEWIPPNQGSALYLRPMMFATDDFLGVRSSETYAFIVFTSPVGPYYNKPVKIKVAEKYVRAFPGGTGFAKAAGNYAASLLPVNEAKKEGYDQILWMDGLEFKYVQEIGTMNVFFVIDDVVITPATDGSILNGVTRDSFIKLLRHEGLKVEERPLTIDEIVEAHEQGKLTEIFGAGTAAVVSHISLFGYKGKKYELPPVEDRVVGNLAKQRIDALRAGEIEDTFGWLHDVKINSHSADVQTTS